MKRRNVKIAPEVKFFFFLVCALILSLLSLAGKTCSVAHAQESGEFDATVSAWSTEFDAKGNRSENIALAAKNFESLVVQPGETVSFNAVVGARTAHKGFKLAKAINGGKMVKELGGGVCQVSGTLHAALIHSGVVEIVEHYHHSRKSSYLDAGLDATVSWGDKKDLVFKNTFSAPILIQAAVTPSLENPKKSNLTFTVLSYVKPYDVEVDVVVLFRDRAVTVETISDNLDQKWRINVEKASDGIAIRKTITVKNPATGEVVSRTEEVVHYTKVNGLVSVPKENTVGGTKTRCYACRKV